jgi:hypothetical protein
MHRQYSIKQYQAIQSSTKHKAMQSSTKQAKAQAVQHKAAGKVTHGSREAQHKESGLGLLKCRVAALPQAAQHTMQGSA